MLGSEQLMTQSNTVSTRFLGLLHNYFNYVSCLQIYIDAETDLIELS